ncbi:hypothetical protein [Flavobacterium hibisci]|uniref:hypothetical protein n=1 Tax=Flavobacterium hibisci TaxID=1914462 RepID=UPI001CBDB41B|nr:hypothetical protein [Flavobacterium hibisci]
MKKILFLFGALAFALTSCSSDDDSSGSSDLVLLKKEISTDSDGDKVITNYAYDGNKIVKITVDGSTDGVYFTYTGNLITKMEFKYDGDVEQINKYEYDSNNLLISFVMTEPLEEYGFKEVYKYETDGSITVTTFRGDDVAQTTANGTRKITFTAGEITKITSTDSPSRSYTYDDKNNPFKNILGYDKISFVEGEASGIVHNIVSEKDLDNNEVTSSYVFTYNAANYPTKVTESEEGETATVEYFY